MKKRKMEGEDLWQWARKAEERAQEVPVSAPEGEAAGITRHLRGLLLSFGRKLRRSSPRRE